MRFTPRPEGRRQLVEALGFGLLVLGYAIETAAKARTPVRGGFRSFAPDGPIGGTLRRSEHTVAYVDGARISPQAADDNGAVLPSYVAGKGAIVFVGTNSGYGFWVHNGTSLMAARPFFDEALGDVRGRESALIAAGARKHLSRA